MSAPSFRRLAPVVAVAVGIGVSPADAAAQAGGTDPQHAAKLGGRALTFRTVPVTPGIKLHSGGRTYVTNRRGKVGVPITALEHIPRGAPAGSYRNLPDGTVFKAPKVTGTRLPGGGIARFDRFFGGGTVAIARFYDFRPTFVNLQGEAVDPKLIEGYRLKSRTGEVLNLKGGRSVRLQSSRVVPFSGKPVSKNIEWSVERVIVDGTNVVQRAKQRFVPHTAGGRPYPVRLLFFKARFTSKDALFGFHMGSELVLTYPSGITRRYKFPDSGELVLPVLPRGEYQVTVKTLGFAPERPVAVSRPQDVDLKVISYLDIAVGGLLLGAILLGLPLAARPDLREKLLRRIRRRAETPVP